MLLYSLLKQIGVNRNPLFFYSGYLEGVSIGERFIRQASEHHEILTGKRSMSELAEHDTLWVCPVALLSYVLSERIEDLISNTSEKPTANGVLAYIGGLCYGLHYSFVYVIGRRVFQGLWNPYSSDVRTHKQFMSVLSSFQVALDALLVRLYEASFLDENEVLSDAAFYENLTRSKICMDYQFLEMYRAICDTLLGNLPDSKAWLSAITDFDVLNEKVEQTYTASSGEDDESNPSQYVPLPLIEMINTIQSMIETGKRYA